MIFASDNWSGAAPEIARSLMDHSTGMASAYGTSELDLSLEQKFNDLFEREVAVYFVGTGTAANSLAMAAVNKPGGFALCHREAHMIEDECGAPEFFTSGGRLAPVDGLLGKIDSKNLASELKRFSPGSVHHGQPMAVSITQATEVGTVYSLNEIKTIAEICHEADLPLHMDGARFANAMVALGATPAEMTWKQGVDVLSFGGTKNGCWCAEALIFFNPEKAKELPFIRKRAGQLFSKTRFIAAQFHAYLEDDLWVRLATHSNAMATMLDDVFNASANIKLAWVGQANERFVVMKRESAEKLFAAGAKFNPWLTPHTLEFEMQENEGFYRFVTSFATTEQDIADFKRVVSSL